MISFLHCTARSALVALVALHASCASGAGAPRTATVASGAPTEGPARPASCDAVDARADLQERIEATPEGGALCLSPGDYVGPFTLDRRLEIWGPRDAVLRSNGTGTTVSITADGVRLAGVTVDGSGARYDTEDAAVKVHQADEVKLEGLLIVNAVFGILSERTNGIVIEGNEVHGNAAAPLGMRGDAIRLWETREGLVQRNHVVDSRDIVVWYSPSNRVIENRVERGRYGTHFMYSSDNEAAHNEYRSNAVGIFVMYSRNIHVHHNRLLDADGPSGMGLGLKESGNVRVHDNAFVHNAIGLYVDTSPLQRGDEDVFERNAFRLSDRAVVFHGRSAGNRLAQNAFVANAQQVEIEGGGTALDAVWEGNHFDDYAGYDLDDDGAGDVPYEIRSLSNELTASHPNLAFFRGTPALSIVEALGKLVPLFEPRTLMRDERPAMADPALETLL